MKLATKTLIGIVLGICTGLGLSIYAPGVYNPLNNYVLDPIGTLFIKAISMIVIPLVFSAIVTSITSTGSVKRLGQLGTRTISLFVITTIIACTIGILTTIAIGPGINVTLTDSITTGSEGNPGGHGTSSPDTSKTPTLRETILNIIPSNAIGAMAAGNMIQVLIFSIFFGIAMAILGEKVESMRIIISQLNEMMMKLVQIFMKVIPYAAFALVAEAMGTAGVGLVGSIAKYLIAILVGLAIQVFIVYGSMLTLLAKVNPIDFFRKMMPAIGTGFATT
jgi:Na+/H+-dicarboxylate symporter